MIIAYFDGQEELEYKVEDLGEGADEAEAIEKHPGIKAMIHYKTFTPTDTEQFYNEMQQFLGLGVTELTGAILTQKPNLEDIAALQGFNGRLAMMGWPTSFDQGTENEDDYGFSGNEYFPDLLEKLQENPDIDGIITEADNTETEYMHDFGFIPTGIRGEAMELFDTQVLAWIRGKEDGHKKT